MPHIDLDGDYEERPGQRIALRSFGSMIITRYIDALTVEDNAATNKADVVINGDAYLQVEVLKQLTMLYVVRRPSLAVIQRGQGSLVESLWDWYEEATQPGGDRRLLPSAYRARLLDTQKAKEPEKARIRLVTDLVAGLTEKSALELYRRMSGMEPGSVLDAAAHVS